MTFKFKIKKLKVWGNRKCPCFHFLKDVSLSNKLTKLFLYCFRRETLKSMAGRILECRKLLYDKLRDLGTPGTWEHVVNQKGMFGFTGLNGEFINSVFHHFE